MSGVPVMVSDGSRVCGRKRRREDKSGRAERDSRNSKSAKSHGNSLSLLGGGAAPREHPPLRQSVTSHPTMKPPGQVGNGENYPPFDGLDRGVASLILRVGTAAAGQGRPSQSHLANSNPRYPAAESVSQNTRCRHSRAEATVSVSPSRSDRDVDRQAQLDQARLQQRHGQVIAQFNPCIRIARRSSELLEDNLASLPKRRPCAAEIQALEQVVRFRLWSGEVVPAVLPPESIQGNVELF